MQSIEVPLNGRSYPVLVGPGLLAAASTWCDLVPAAPLVIVTNDKVAPLYLERLKDALSDHTVHEFVLPDGEASKNRDNWFRIIEFLAGIEAGRDTCLIALGGGVIGDLCGFAAATWMRGIDFIQAPTTLLAQVDAAVGGKVAINIAAGKNLVGAFHQPRAVFADTDTLATLPEREYRAGLAEVVKYGAIRDAGFIADLETMTDDLRAREAGALADIIARSVQHKADIVAADEREAGQRAILNFGHSFGHALEAVTGYEAFLHGEAVAIGMVIAASLSELRGLCPTGTAQRLERLLKALQLPVRIPPNIATDDLLERMRLDKKNRAGQQRLVLLEAPGHAVVDSDSPESMIRAAIEACRAPGPHR